ncbi:hypothetical protein [Embleya sp. NPDC020886]|uniref:hypothetical protein n=1 Tax=Embleya sp. NPDC020886 TaxID=3363980 RepID=UPI0037A9A239
MNGPLLGSEYTPTNRGNPVPRIRAGVDIGKTHHHCVVLGAEASGCCRAAC